MKNSIVFLFVFNFSLLFCSGGSPILQIPDSFFAKQGNPFDVVKNPGQKPKIQASKIFDSSILRFKTFTDWDNACSRLPFYKNGGSMKKDSAFKIVGLTQQEAWNEFDKVLDAWLAMKQTHDLAHENNWSMSNLGYAKPPMYFFGLSFMPFAQKLLLKPNDECIIRGDLHGDIHSLMAQLRDLQAYDILDDNFRIVKDNVWMLFLGDYVDRGQYGVEVIYTLLRLSLANPERVILVRGNHEDKHVNTMLQPDYFAEEVFYKFSNFEMFVHGVQDVRAAKIYGIYDFLPVVLYVGCQDLIKASEEYLSTYVNWVQCCHGGIELGYDPLPFLHNHATKYQLLGSLNRKQFLDLMQKLCTQGMSESKKTELKQRFFELQAELQNFQERTDLASYASDNLQLKFPASGQESLDFLWGDFEVSSKNIFTAGRSLCLGEFATKIILKLKSDKQNKLVEIIRAHQHAADTLPLILASCGVCKWWKKPETQLERSIDDALVTTFNVAPDSGYGFQFNDPAYCNLPVFDYDTYATLKVEQQLKNWRLRVRNRRVYL